MSLEFGKLYEDLWISSLEWIIWILRLDVYARFTGCICIYGWLIKGLWMMCGQLMIDLWRTSTFVWIMYEGCLNQWSMDSFCRIHGYLVQDLRMTWSFLCEICGWLLRNMSMTHARLTDGLWSVCGWIMDKMWRIYAWDLWMLNEDVWIMFINHWCRCYGRLMPDLWITQNVWIVSVRMGSWLMEKACGRHPLELNSQPVWGSFSRKKKSKLAKRDSSIAWHCWGLKTMQSRGGPHGTQVAHATAKQPRHHPPLWSRSISSSPSAYIEHPSWWRRESCGFDRHGRPSGTEAAMRRPLRKVVDRSWQMNDERFEPHPGCLKKLKCKHPTVQNQDCSSIE